MTGSCWQGTTPTSDPPKNVEFREFRTPRVPTRHWEHKKVVTSTITQDLPTLVEALVTAHVRIKSRLNPLARARIISLYFEDFWKPPKIKELGCYHAIAAEPL